MKVKFLSIFVWLIIGASAALAQNTVFTYQGRLNDGGSPANSTYDMQFKLFDAVSAGNQIGSTVTNPSVQVTNGIFTVQIDFTATPFNGQTLYLEIGIRPAGSSGSYTALAPRQRLSSAPCGTYQIEKSVIASGGGASSGGTYSLESTTGQPLAGGFMQGSLYSVFSGFLTPNLAPTAAGVTVAGRVLTPTGRGLTSATVLLTDAFGNTRTTRTSTFGYYRFEEVEAGQTYIFSVRSKRYQFAPQVIAVNEDMEDLNFTAQF